MTTIEQASNRLVIQYKPWLAWLVGVLFIVGGLWPMTAGEPLFGGAFVLAGVGIVLGLANTVTSGFDLTTRRFTQSTKGLIRNKELIHPIDEITQVRVVQGNSSANSPSRTYTIVAALRSGARVQIPSHTGGGKAQKEQLAADIRGFLNLADMPEPKIPGFGDLFALMRDPNPAQRLGEMFGGTATELEAIVRRDPANLEAREQLATTLAMQNRPAEARAHLVAARDLAKQRRNDDRVARLDEMIARLTSAADRRQQS
jgi:hypothetical protein